MQYKIRFDTCKTLARSLLDIAENKNMEEGMAYFRMSVGFIMLGWDVNSLKEIASEWR